MASPSPKEITQKPISISILPSKTGPKEITSRQGSLPLSVQKRKTIKGVEMGVLSDGTPFLTQRGLARLCGVENAHIGSISSGWLEASQKPRISKVKDLIEKRGQVPAFAHIEVRDGGILIYAYSDLVCLAVLEYYAFDAGSNKQQQAQDNFRLLAGKALQDFIYAQVGYDPDNNIPLSWKQFHDRVSLTYNAVPRGYFGVFKEIADMIVTLGQAGLHIDQTFVPDISVGSVWAAYWAENCLEVKYGKRLTYQHNYPSYFPQALSNPQNPWCYPEGSLGEFRGWFRENYIGSGKFKAYLAGKVRQQQIPASFAQLALTAYEDASD